MKYIRTYESIDFNEDDFDWIQDEGKFDFILDNIKNKKMSILLIDEENYEDFLEFSKEHGIDRLSGSFKQYEELGKMYLYIDYNKSIGYMRFDNYTINYNKNNYTNIEIHNFTNDVNESIQFNEDDFDWIEDEPLELLEIGDRIKLNKQTYWYHGDWRTDNRQIKCSYIRKIIGLEHTSTVNYCLSEYDGKTIEHRNPNITDYDGYLVLLDGLWPWFQLTDYEVVEKG